VVKRRFGEGWCGQDPLSWCKGRIDETPASRGRWWDEKKGIVRNAGGLVEGGGSYCDQIGSGGAVARCGKGVTGAGRRTCKIEEGELSAGGRKKRGKMVGPSPGGLREREWSSFFFRQEMLIAFT